ncbi:MAG TPA: NAD-dependent epimerase/dehydratase family protein [Armatimonadota bacterium]|nr:NAD-dependent epimerase/dehydratase family protein [Armatimonadota bacterium]
MTRAASGSTAIVAGGAGFIGSHLCEKLLSRGAHVLCLDSLITGARSNIEPFTADPRFRFIEVDISEGLPDDLPDADVVFNLASPASPKDFRSLALQILRVAGEGTRHLLEHARACSAVFVQASTSEVYGEPLEHPQTESYWGHVNPVGERSCYDEGKRYAEALIMAYRRLHNVDGRLARIFNTYGPRMRPDDGRVVPNFILQALAGEPLTIYGDGTRTRGFCFVEDTVAALVALADADPDAIDADLPAYNIGNPEEITIRQFAERVRDVCGSSSELKVVPLPQADDPTRRCPVIDRMRALTGWEPVVGLEEGLRQTRDWLAQQE